MLKGFSVTTDSWLSFIGGFRAIKVQLNETPTQSNCEDLRAWLENYADFAYIKVDCSDTLLNTLVRRANFFVVETNVQLRYLKGAHEAHECSCVALIREALPSDEEALAFLGSTAFTESRFFQDPWFPLETAKGLKESWVRNYFRGKRGDYMFVAELDDRPVGFLQALKSGPDTLIIDLIAVERGLQGQGLGRALIDALLKLSYETKWIVVGTQLRNFSSLNFYESYGFRFSAAKHVLHWHRQPLLYEHALPPEQ